MKRENKKEAELTFDIEIGDDVRVVAFCSDCGSVIYKGGDSTPIEHRVLREGLIDHLNHYNWDHEIDLIYPRRKTDRTIDAQIYLSTGARLTIEAERRRQSRSM